MWIIQREEFTTDYLGMINDHLREVRPELVPSLAIERYEAMQREGRLIWITARTPDALIGFSGHWWYRDLHFAQRIGHDDLWHVAREWRGKGIGRTLKQMGLTELAKAGAAYTSDHLRYAFGKNDLMLGLGYHRTGTIWRKPLT